MVKTRGEVFKKGVSVFSCRHSKPAIIPNNYANNRNQVGSLLTRWEKRSAVKKINQEIVSVHKEVKVLRQKMNDWILGYFTIWNQIGDCSETGKSSRWKNKKHMGSPSESCLWKHSQMTKWWVNKTMSEESVCHWGKYCPAVKVRSMGILKGKTGGNF